MTAHEPTERDAVVERYSGLARIAVAGGTPLDACGPDTDCYGATRYDPNELDTVPDAARRAGLGCGNPHAVADIRPGDVVLDLGSGGGLDLILSARRTGPHGHAHGLDASADMRALARANLADAGITNATVLDGHIEAIPLPDASVDVVISNCVINLSTDKAAVFNEARRVLRPGGRLGITDIVTTDPDAPGTGAMSTGEYRAALSAAGFAHVEVTPTHSTGPGLDSVIVRASAPRQHPATIRPMTPDDWPAVQVIYAAGIVTGNATFEDEPPTWEAFDGTRLADHRLVAVNGGRVVGWAAVVPVSDRCVYGGVVEHSAYVDPAHTRRGVGRALLEALIATTEEAGIWTIQSGIFPENTASLALHERCGFRVVGRRERLGRDHGRWRDVILVERRSTVTGT
jgi:L-amino acid N-acyltransferase YncA/precorrin-6B methylase 2